jgi:hypothetical protein
MRKIFGHRHFALLLVLALLLAPRMTHAQNWTWKTEDIDVEGSGTGVTVDQEGNLHASYYVAHGGFVRYGFRPVDQTKWFKMDIDSSLGVLETNIALDASGNPNICYTPLLMKFARFDGRKWLKQEVDPRSGIISYICSLQISPDNKPMMTWYLESGTYLRYAILENGAWTARSLQGGGGDLPGKWTSMALDAKGHPHVSYSNFPTGFLKYAAYDGKSWSLSTVDVSEGKPDDGGQRGMGNSLVLDKEGKPIIAYYDEQSLKVARLVDGRWKKEVVETLPNFGKWSWKIFRSNILFDSKGNLHIGFESLNGLEHAWWDGSQWRTQLLVGSLGSSVFENSMAIDKKDNLYMIYRDPADSSLRMAVGKEVAVQKNDAGH